MERLQVTERHTFFMKYYLAPMEGLTTYNFRTNWNRYYGGMDKYFTPFISNRHMNSRERNDVMPEHNEGMYTVPQILTNKAEEFLSLAEQLAGYGYCEVNLNLGCPSGTVVARNRGAGFLGTPRELEAFLDEVFGKCPLEISIKTRIGMDYPDEWTPLLQIYRKFPMKELIIHPRLQKEGYKGTPHLEAFAEAAETLQCPLCYNGDITSPKTLSQILAQLPMIDTVMIGRGILQNPGLLQHLKDASANSEGESLPSSEDRLVVLKEFHSSLLTGYQEIMSGDTNTLYKMKDLWTFLSLSFESPDKYVKKIRKATDVSDYKLAVNSLFRECALK